jgi:hypothetical protein
LLLISCLYIHSDLNRETPGSPLLKYLSLILAFTLLLGCKVSPTQIHVVTWGCFLITDCSCCYIKMS